jgi:transforming growth factor-beta-induced protein
MKSRNTVVMMSLAASFFAFANPAAAGQGCGNKQSATTGTPVMQTAGTVQAAGTESKVSDAKSMNIVQTAIGAGSFKTLVAAVQAAGLVETLSGKGPFTVFAPTDEAFAKLPKGTVEELLKPENKAKLTAILTYHVVAGNVMSTDVVKLKSAKTVQGQDLSVMVADGKVMINNAQVIKADIVASNGVIHVVDTVLLPKEK